MWDVPILVFVKFLSIFLQSQKDYFRKGTRFSGFAIANIMQEVSVFFFFFLFSLFHHMKKKVFFLCFYLFFSVFLFTVFYFVKNTNKKEQKHQNKKQ